MASITIFQNSTSPTTLISSITSLISSSSLSSISPPPTSSFSNCTTANSTYNNATGTCNNVNLNLWGWDWTYMIIIIPFGLIVAWGLFLGFVLLIDKIIKKRWIQRGVGAVRYISVGMWRAVVKLFVDMWTAMAKKRREKQEKRVRKEAVELERRVDKAGRVAVEVL